MLKAVMSIVTLSVAAVLSFLAFAAAAYFCDRAGLELRKCGYRSVLVIVAG